MATIKIPRRPQKNADGLKKEEMDCLNWHVLFGDPIEECYARFVVPQFRDNPKLMREYAKQFMASSAAKNYLSAYRDELAAMFREREAAHTAKSDDGDEDLNARRKRKSVEKIMARVAEMVDEISDAESLLDTIKAMKDTGYFDEATKVRPPGRWLPLTCMECELKQFVDKHVKSGDIEYVENESEAEPDDKVEDI